MADLQDELHTTTEVGALDDLPPSLPDPDDLPESLSPPVGAEPSTAVADPDATPLERARALLDAHPVADGYSGLPWALRHLPWFDLELGESAVDTDVPRLREGHVGALLWSLHLPGGLDGDRAVGATLEQLDLVKTVVRTHPEGLRLAYTAGQTTDVRNCGRIAVLLGPAGAAALGDSLGILRSLHALGLRALTLSGVSWASEAGLTRFGEEVLREMNRLGVLADLSGASEETIRRAVAVSKSPVLCTRSAARVLRPHPANLPDDLLAELGAAKGLCMVPLTAEQTGATVRDVADHLDHVRTVAGAESVGLSGTYDAGTAHPQELADASCYPHLIAELLRRGWTESDVALLTWGNVQRVLRGADFTARAAQQRREPSTAKIAELDG
ncbi:dipeptidase [Streptomyces lincolnensis]|uniref:Dipeptidase n=1 Tax=Streptomyces lincolnensis TaxID=1915 RepID=A0A1B1MAP2_STRLN|nr:dipeptidase [Streptomyces lincolnensis]ANS65691.1 dipeptidase [Streptomyces lincolnensis]AXG54546.1 dipeptidase [Streptomyces lincolnensis]QMV08910.1 membrane dipeptidase [Streptomyces lincolnensis]